MRKVTYCLVIISLFFSYSGNLRADDSVPPIRGFKSIELGMTEKEVKAAIKGDKALRRNSDIRGKDKTRNVYLKGFFFDFMSYKNQTGVLRYNIDSKRVGSILLFFKPKTHKDTGATLKVLHDVLYEKYGESDWASVLLSEDYAGELGSDDFNEYKEYEAASWEQVEYGRSVILAAIQNSSTRSSAIIGIADESYLDGSKNGEEDKTKSPSDDF